MEGEKKKNWIPPKKKWKCSASWWALRSQASSVVKTEVWLPPAARHKNNSLHSQAGDKRANQFCVVYTILYFDSGTTLSLPLKSASCFFTTGGQSHWFCKRKVNVWCRFQLCAMDCMQARGSICFLLIGVWRSSAHQDSPFYRLTHTHIHTLSLNKTEPCVYNSPAAGTAAIVCRLIVTWWNHVTDVPVRS